MPPDTETIEQITARLKQEAPAVVELLRAHREEHRQEGIRAARPDLHGYGFEETPGQVVADSPVLRSAAEQLKGTQAGPWMSAGVPIPIRLGAPDLGTGIGMRQVVTAADASAGSLIGPDFRGLIDASPTARPLFLRQLVTVLRTESDAILWAKETTKVDAATPVAEASALTGTSGQKPAANFVAEAVTVPVETIAVHIAATSRVLEDATGLRDYLNASLRQDVEEVLEEQMLDGDGVSPNLDGIINQVPVGNQVGALGGPFQSIRQAIRLVKTTGKARASAVVVNPIDAEAMDVTLVNAEANHFISSPRDSVPPRVWGLPLLESEAIAENTALVGDFTKAILFDRMAASLKIGVVGDQFTRNLVTLLVELRAAFVVSRPAAFATATV